MKTETILTLIIALLLAAFPLAAQEEERTTIGGYGELHYNEPDGAARGTLDFHRFVIFVGHSFNDRLSFKSELEIEHTKIEGGSGGEVALEQAYLDYHVSSALGLRAGILLPPVGIINQFHEPPTFNGVERPNVERTIIPATWRESGAGIYGTLTEGLNYQLYVMAGLLAEGFTGSGGIRGGRQEAAESSPANPSFTGRLDYLAAPGLRIGGSFFAGNSTGGDAALGSGTVALLSGDIRYAVDRFSFRAVGAHASIGNASEINLAYGNGVADRIYGYYVEGAYNIMPALCESSEAELLPFVRYERYNTQAAVTGFTANPAYDRDEVTVGATLKPTYNTAVKIDYQFLGTAAGTDAKLLNIGIGYHFN
jgi:hypothetical protein